MAPVLVDEPEGVEDLHRLVGVERRHDLGDRVEVPVEELAEAAVVVDGPRPGAPGDEELEARDTERVLHVDRDEADSERVVGGWMQRMIQRPRLGLPRPVLVGNAPDLADPFRVEMGRNRKHEA